MIEPLHAVTYFTAEAVDAARQAGLRGFWMGYFGCRAAPLGAVGPGTVEAVFANFAPSMVERAIPDAWTYAAPEVLVVARAEAAATALRRLVPDIDAVAERTTEPLGRIADAATSIGRPLFAANRGIGPFDDPVARLWQLCTTLREHRGDGHVVALAAADITGCQAHHLLAASLGWPDDVFFDNRGWSTDDRASARSALVDRGLVDDDGLTEHGALVRARIEATTDDLAATPITQALSAAAIAELLDALSPAAVAVTTSGELPFPNPMGLPRPTMTAEAPHRGAVDEEG
ncbi:MAG: hypothetical protein AAF962_08575 [Actinomycetota bacterium]